MEHHKMENIKKFETATLAGGCFWCTEAIFKRLKGVQSVIPGYSGGDTAGRKSPTYEQVSTGNTGHAEAIQIKFDPAVISFQVLLDVLFATHDPTTKNRQGADVGTQYRSVIFYHSNEQKQKAEDKIGQLEKEGKYNNPLVTEVAPYTAFYKAEDYHYDYYGNNPDKPYCRIVIDPKIRKLYKDYTPLIKEDFK